MKKYDALSNGDESVFFHTPSCYLLPVSSGTYFNRDMEPLAFIIFIGIPVVAAVAGIYTMVVTLLRWNKGSLPVDHYIASRMQFEPTDAQDAEWLKELETLQLAYRHTVC